MPSAILPLCLGVFLRASADVLLYAYLPLYLYSHLGETRLWLISLVPTVPAFIRFVMAPMWGRLADRIGRQRSFIAMGLAAYAILLAALPHMDQATPMIVALAVFAVPYSAFNPVARTWLSLAERGEALFHLARWHQWEAAGFVASSAIVGWFATDHSLAFVQAMRWEAGLLAVCALAIAWHLPNRPTPTAATRHRSSPASPSLSANGRRPADRNRSTPVVTRLPAAAILFLLVSSLVWESVATSFGLYFTESLSGSVRAYGLTLSGSTFISLVAYGALAGVGRRRGERPLFQAAAWGYTAMFFLIAWPSPWTAAIGYLLPLSTVVRTAFNLLILGRVPRSERGQAMGMMEAAEACSGTVGALVGGMLADHVGLSLIPQVALWSTLLLHILTWRLRF